MNNKPTILVIGAGAIGAYYGGRLAQVGADVSVAVRSDYDFLQSQPYQIKSCDGDFEFVPSQVIRTAGEYVGNPDYVIVATKVLPGTDTVELLRGAVHENTAIVLMQNGAEIEQNIASAYPDNEIISVLCFICSGRTAPGHIHHQDYGHIAIGSFPQGKTKKLIKLGELFQNAGVKCEVSENAVQARWKKLVWNAPYNPLSVLAGCVDTKQIMDNSWTAELARNIMEEVYTIAKAVGAEFDHSFIQQNIDATMKMKAYKPSMLLDYENGREMEVEAILGNTVKAARRVGVETPRIDSLYALLQLINSKANC